MALSRPLRLKSEIAKQKAEGSSSDLPVARVWVDSGVFHLDQKFDYLVPDNLAHQVSTGIRVQVPFHGREVEAIVLSREASSDASVLKSITKVLSSRSIATAESLNLIAAVSLRWAAHPFDVIRSAIPQRVSAIDKEDWVHQTDSLPTVKPFRTYIHMPPAVDRFEFLRDTISTLPTSGSTLVIFPDAKSVKRMQQVYPKAIVLDSALERAERYRNFLKVRFGQNLIVLGTRSAVFAPIIDLAHIMVFDEGSELHYEQRSPGWNTRDVAILRSESTKCRLTFVGYSPSSEVARLIENKWVKYSATHSRVNIAAFPQTHGELLPSRLVGEIRRALSSGPVLFVSPRKGYSQAIVCSRCRNIALCACGGTFMKKSALSPLECVICGDVRLQWNCAWCRGITPFLMGRGSERFAFEIGAAFPGEQIIKSTSEALVENLSGERALVIATPGAAPRAPGGYALVVILEAERFFAQADIRAHERSREIFFAHAAMSTSHGKVALVMPTDHPIIGAIAAWKPSLISQRELRERLEVNLPPFSRAVTLDIDSSESQSLLRGLKKAQADERLPASTHFLGPSQLRNGDDRIVALSPIADGEALVSLLHEFQRRRSSSKKTLATIRIDPYSLSR